jgi:sugar phosphate isomerase/epimerase
VLGSSDFNWGEFLTVSAARGGTEWYIIEHDSPQREEAKVCFDRLRRFQDVNG